MATNFKLKRSAVASKRPGTTDLELGELALNTYDGFLYSETTGAGSTVSLLTPWQERYGQGSVYYNGGNVGIGTSHAQEKLHIHEPSNSPCDLRLSNNEGYGFIRGDSNLLAYNAQLHLFANRDRSTEYARITNQGRVGIATAVPATILDVNGDVTFRTANGYNLLFDKSDNSLKFGDSVRAKFGASTDMEIYHTTAGSGTNFIKGTGNLLLQSNVIVLEDQSGDDYIRIDTGGAVKINHPGSTERIRTTSTGVKVTGLTSTTSLAVTGIATFLSAASFLDNDVLYFGGSSSTGISTDYRLRIYSDGTDSYISEATGAGDLRLSSDSRVEIRNAALNHTVASFNTGVGVTVFDRFKVSGISSFTGNVDLGISTSTTITATSRFDSDLVPSTNVARDLGSSENQWRTLYVSNLVVAPGGPGFAGSNLTVNNLKVIGISTFLDHADFDSVSIGSTLNVAGVSTFNNNVHLLDDDKLQLGGTPGTVDGLELYHASNHSYIDDTGSGNLKVRSNNLRISNGGESKVYATFTPTVVDLYADNDVRLTTSGAGVTVTGIITATTGHFDSVTGPSTITIDPATIGDNTGTVVIKGDLQVDGTTTTVNSTTLTVTDKNIEIAKGAGNDAAVDGAGITVDSTQGDKTWNWVDATDAWTSSEHIHVAAGKRLGFADDPNTFIDRPRADTIEFTTNNIERVSITGIGSVGVGITNPHVPLHIETATTGAITSLLKLHGPFTSNTGSEGTAIDFGTAADVSVGARIIGTREAAGAKGALRFCTGRESDSDFNDGHMVIDETGKVGIGSAIPDHALDVVGAIRAHLNNPTLFLQNLSSGGAYTNRIFFGDASTFGKGSIIYENEAGGENYLRFKVGGNTGNNIERLTIQGSADGNVGIGSAIPTAKLDVKGDAKFSDDVFINVRGKSFKTSDWSIFNTTTGNALSISGGNSASVKVHIKNDGSVGIGSTIPDAKLSVVGVGTFKEDVYVDKKLYVGGIEIIGPGTGIGTDITTRHLRATGITTTEQLLDADGGADIAGIATAGFVHVGNLTSGRVAYVGAGGSITDSSNLTFDGSTLLVTGTLNSTVDVQINGTSVVDTALNDAVAMAIALG